LGVDTDGNPVVYPSFTKTISVDSWHESVTSVQITGKVWVFDTWESSDTITIEVKNSNGDILGLNVDGTDSDSDGTPDPPLGQLTFIGKGDSSVNTDTDRLTYQAITDCGVPNRVSGIP